MDAALETPLIVVRALHYAAAIVLFGEFAWLYCVAPRGEAPPRFRAIAGWSLAIALVTAFAWLAIEAANMSGLPLAEALREGTVGVVLSSTLFGHAWMVRGALAVAVIAALVAMGPRGDGSPGARAVAALGAALFLAALACAGHAAAEAGAQRLLHVVADALHLLAASAWVGALLPFAMFYRAIEARPSAQGLADAALAARRFSLLGITAVGVLAASGIVNACYTLQRPSDLVSSRYGQVLLAKLAVVAAMLALAAVNRMRFTPRLVPQESAAARSALRSLGRNALAELALGFLVVAIVAKLGITMPPMPGH